LNRELNIKNELFNLEECNYNPYLSKWKGEDDYLNLEQSGVNINKVEFSINHDKINSINKKIWNED
jgi:hypothetical protein